MIITIVNHEGANAHPTAPNAAEVAGAEGATRPITTACLKARDRGVLIQMSGSEAGRVHPLVGDSWTLGRGHACSVRFDDVTLSRVHARIARSGRDYLVEDTGSLNGSYVNDVRIRRASLQDGDRLRLGSGASMRFQIVDAEEQDALARTYESSIRDGLTGVLNRRRFEERLAAEVSAAVKHGARVSVILLDLDHFKRINDTHGHLAGDAVLRRAAQLACAAAGADDIVARYGGEELVLVVRGATLEGAAGLAEQLRAALERAEIAYGDELLRVTASFGVASCACVAPDGTAAALLARADARLYAAKGAGRNRVCAG